MGDYLIAPELEPELVLFHIDSSALLASNVILVSPRSDVRKTTKISEAQ